MERDGVANLDPSSAILSAGWPPFYGPNQISYRIIDSRLEEKAGAGIVNGPTSEEPRICQIRKV